MMESHARDMRHAPHEHEFENELTPAALGMEHLTLQDLRRVRLRITADIGRCPLYVRDVLELKRGTVLALNKMAGELCDLYVNGIPLAKGEVVVIGDNLHVRISEIFGTFNQEGKEVYE